jgi:hypothetical protein
MTGPTYPVRGSVEIEGQRIKHRLLRTHESTDDAVMRLAVPDTSISGQLRWRRFKSHDPWFAESLPREGNELVIRIPKQPSAGKVMYEVTLVEADGTRHDLIDETVIIRFKDPVPQPILIPHVILMFAAMLLSTRTGLEAVVGGSRARRLAWWTAGLLFVGGLIMGPLVQKYAFGALWTGWPFGHDLTDNKTLVAMIFWVVAIWRSKPPRSGRIWIIVAAIVTLAIYLIPHSVLGSELDFTRMEQQEILPS